MATRDETQAAAAEAAGQRQPHGGLLAARRLKARGVTKLFTLSGGHLFSLYDGCRAEGIDLIDTRHESAAAFAAEGWAKVTREPGLCALTAGPGVTNGMSAIASAHKNRSPMVVLGGRAPQMRWGQGSLQEIDHVPFVAPVTKSARTVASTADIPTALDEAFTAALTPHYGPTFVDFPLDYVFRELEGEASGALPATLRALREAVGARDEGSWPAELRETENAKRAGERAELDDDRAPLHPMRVYRELAEAVDRDTIVVGDGGDFVSYAGRVFDSYEPGCWLDPGPYGCLGSGPGYALAAKLARPDRAVLLLLGDGAFGFSGMEFDTLVRHGVPVVGVMGNNGIWALEKHPMEFLYGYSVAAELRPGTRYDQVVEALGGHGELVERPDELRPALARAFESGKPALVNVLTDPNVVYPRKSNLA